MKYAFILLSLLVCISSCQTEKSDSRPNILLIVADDLGYADIGAYGGDIETPNLDQLAKSGMLFSRFHASPLCAPTRAMLLSGNDNHIAGMGIQGESLNHWGYEGRISNRVALIPEVLLEAGYNTYIAGKWHLGSTEETNPHSRGFSRSFVNKISSGNHYSSRGLFGSMPVTEYTENGKKAEWPEGKFSTDHYTDKLIEFIDNDRESGQPFFAFAAYTAPHWPLQVDEDYRKKYEGKYDAGYDKLKRRRLESLIQAGLIPEGTPLPPNHPRVIPWDSLSGEQRMSEVRKMEIYAGMVDNLDRNIGRIFTHLKETGQFENTLVVFMSDNGAAAEDFYNHPRYGIFLKDNYTDSYQYMGSEQSFISYGPQWAEAGTSPFRYFKGQLTEGGMLAPFIVSGPGVKNGTYEGMLSLQDIAPTFYELAGTEYPDKYKGKEVYPLRGQSILPLLKGETDQFWTNDRIFAMEHAGRTMLRKGDWKLLNNRLPWDPENFQLFYMGEDIGEFNDLKDKNPEKFNELLSDWQKYIEEVKAQVPPPTAFD